MTACTPGDCHCQPADMATGPVKASEPRGIQLHGHVLPGGMRARCGGPGLCQQCRMEEAIVGEMNAHGALAGPRAAADQLAQAEAERDRAYSERALLLAILAKAYDSCLAYSDPAAPGWAVLTITGPTGQLCWHIHPRDFPVLDQVEWCTDPPAWDGHSTSEKEGRLALLVGMLTG